MRNLNNTNLIIGDFIWSIKGMGYIVSINGDSYIIEEPPTKRRISIVKSDITDVAWMPRNEN